MCTFSKCMYAVSLIGKGHGGLPSILFSKLLLYPTFVIDLKSVLHLANICNLFWLLSGAAKSSPASKPGSTPSRPSSAKRASSSSSASRSDKDLETQVIQLNEQVTPQSWPVSERGRREKKNLEA